MFKIEVKKNQNLLNQIHKFKFNSSFFLLKIIHQCLKNGKKKKYCYLFLNYLAYHFRKNFYKNNMFYLKLKFTTKNLLFNLRYYPQFFNFVKLFNLFFTCHPQTLGFFVKQNKVFINRKKKYFSSVYFFIIQPQNRHNQFLKFVKLLYLKKNFKKTMPILLKQNLYKPTNSHLKKLFQTLIFSIVWEQSLV